MNLETSLSNAICGHEHQRMRLARLLHTNRLPQSMIFAGPTGIGKSLVAAELVQTIFCDKGSAQTYGGCGECKSCHLFAVGNHPDLHLVDCNQWKVDQVRELLSALALKSYEGRARAVIFNDAEQLNTQSLNALLKTLEEPRPDTYFVLVTSNPAKLLQTVLSRCHKFHFDPLTAAEVELLITKGNIETGELTLKEITLLSDGSMENIEKLSEHAAT
ncbi:MAG: AAA family ATPase, partial [Bdellovibrionales bacterium]|nr:AAA family ATPase [Bdellovibrionales bacterium]